MEKSFKKTLLASLALLMAGLLALTTVTYAWFTTGDTASVGQFELNVAGADGLLISTEAATGFKSQVSWAEIAYANSATTCTSAPSSAASFNGTAIKLSPLSAAATTDTTGKLVFYKGTLSDGDDKILSKVEATTGPTDGYIYFDLYVYNSGATDKTVYLGDAQTTQVSKTSVTAVAPEEGDVRSDLAIRMAFVEEGNAAYGTTSIGDATSQITAKIYEPNAKEHTAAGLAYYKALGNSSATATDKFSYKALNATSTDPVSVTAASLAAVTTYDESREATGLSFTAPAGKVLKLRVYTWAEGQDPDCLNDISSGKIKIDLKFDASVKAE